MRLLLDSHALLWWLLDDSRLSRAALHAIRNTDTDVFVSAASAWEICTKHRIGKLPVAEKIASAFGQIVLGEGFLGLSVSVTHAEKAGSMPGLHKDPFDRMLIAQALIENLTLVSNETRFDAFGVKRLW